VQEGSEEQGCVLKVFDHGNEKRLQRELGVLMQLEHPNIVPLQGLCRQLDPPKYFLQLPLFPGNLKAALAEKRNELKGKEEWDLWVGGLLRGLLEAISYLHQMGYLHRDLKLENVLVR
jgi:serine/threonine protein kinase